MDIKQLKKYLEGFIQNLKPKNQQLLTARLGSLKSVFPFNEYEYILMFFFDKKIIIFQQYEELREKYVSSNPYLELIQVKACRAINTKKRGNLMEKALRHDSDEPFWMNYQQIKADMSYWCLDR